MSKSALKLKEVEKPYKNQRKALEDKRMKQNILFSLSNIFLESRNQPQLIHPWMNGFKQLEQRIIGTNYIIIGPSQSGKYSAVRYALGTYHHDVKQIIINCQISTTEHQFLCKVLEQFRNKCPKARWPTQQKDINKLIVNEDIEFARLNPFIIERDLKFVIVIRNGQHLVGFKKQTILYNLFEWMSSQAIKNRAGMVILTRQLMLTDRFQKRIKSRFAGNRLCIFRPEKPQIYISILANRIKAVINDKKTWAQHNKINGSSSKMQEQAQQQIYDEEEQDKNDKRKNRSLPKKNSTKHQKTQNQRLSEVLTKNKQNKYIKQLNSYFETLSYYISKPKIHQLEINKFFEQKIKIFENYKSKNKESQLCLFTDQSILTIDQQLECLEKLKEAVQKNSQMNFFFKDKILQYQVITIPFVLRIFQHIFMILDESLIKFLSVQKLKQLLLLLLKKNVEYQFPINVIECNSLENFNNVELLLLIFIFKMIDQNQPSVKLTVIYDVYHDKLHKQIYNYTQASSSKYPIKIIQRAIQRLYRSQTISYCPSNIWNSQIQLLYQKTKVRRGFQHLAKQGKLPKLHLELLKQLNIHPDYSESQKVYVHLPSN